MKVLKFGGTSVGCPEIIEQVVNVVADFLAEEESQGRRETTVVTVSAFGGTTDQLLNTATTAAAGNTAYLEQLDKISQRHLTAAQHLAPTDDVERLLAEVKATLAELADLLHGVFLLREASLRTRDLVMSFGERLSAMIVGTAMRRRVAASDWLDARTVVRTNSEFSLAVVDFPVTNALLASRFGELHSKGVRVVVVTGFIGSTEHGETTTLGRGGSDYTASIVGAALNADEIQIWTDVDGVLTADPRKVPTALLIPSMSYEEAMEMSYFGAKVLYPPTMVPAMDKNIPIRIKNTFNPAATGTVICPTPQPSPFPIRGISSVENVSLINLQGSGMVGVAGVSHRLFGCLAKEGISVILISQASSEHSICFAVDPKVAARATAVLEQEFEFEIYKKLVDSVTVVHTLSIVAVVGAAMHHTPGIAGRIFSAMGSYRINVYAIAQGSSELNISFVVGRADTARAIQAVHDAFFDFEKTCLHAWVIGAGLIGSALLDQIKEQAPVLLRSQQIAVKVMGVATSRKMLLAQAPTAVDLESWRQALDSTGETAHLDGFLAHLRSAPLSHRVLVDCTAGDAVNEFYQSLLDAGVHVVTPNKKANSGPYEKYRTLLHTARQRRVKFLYETNVGAGLPVIGTLRGLLLSGDRLVRLEAVLSGTLSFLFNSFAPGVSFSALVKDAQQRGFTEPDPRDDLSGTDVARKLLILAREAGHALEMSDIVVESLVPPVCQAAASVDEFYRLLADADSDFGRRASDAAARGRRLRYLAKLENGKATVSLQEVDATHAAYGLDGTDNIVIFTTSRYSSTPLVVKGPGAGAQVTAAGVFADLLSIA
eukprot:TRINITY_DN18333_c0_g1_i1.p1 TRINITY_DN18333_c0_g1~~TRINITY_DN18333_c0_g1_i1.p1  ORF type:complete len:827 (+),score=339.22 TRINITY_DN18333_c0_g1_i1:140-2620(+)